MILSWSLIIHATHSAHATRRHADRPALDFSTVLPARGARHSVTLPTECVANLPLPGNPYRNRFLLGSGAKMFLVGSEFGGLSSRSSATMRLCPSRLLLTRYCGVLPALG